MWLSMDKKLARDGRSGCLGLLRLLLFKGWRAYSERNASTASFFEAMRAGICPPNMVRMVLIATRINPCSGV